MLQFRPADDQPPLKWNVTDGRIAEILILADFVTVLRQLGVLPAALIIRCADLKGARPRNPSLVPVEGMVVLIRFQTTIR